MKIKGVVFSGVGEGRLYTEQMGYKKRFFEKLGIDSFHGTLNIKVNGVDAAIVVPERTIYQKDTIEILSTRDLRKTLKLKDGDEVVVE